MFKRKYLLGWAAICSPPKTNTSPEKKGWKTTFLLKWPLFGDMFVLRGVFFARKRRVGKATKLKSHPLGRWSKTAYGLRFHHGVAVKIVELNVLPPPCLMGVHFAHLFSSRYLRLPDGKTTPESLGTYTICSNCLNVPKATIFHLYRIWVHGQYFLWVKTDELA